MATTFQNPLGAVDLAPEGAVYLGKYGAAKGPGAQNVAVTTGDGGIDDVVQITSADGAQVATIPYTELYSFHVITGAGKRKPAISFEHKPSADSPSSKNHV